MQDSSVTKGIGRSRKTKEETIKNTYRSTI